MGPRQKTRSLAAKRRTHRGPIAVLGLSLLVLGLTALGSVALCACGGTSTTASSTPSMAATPTSAPPSIVPATEPVSQWDVPGSASLAQTKAVARRYSAALTAEKIPQAGLYTAASTWDYWPTDQHLKGVDAIEGVYRDAAPALAWAKRSHLLAAPGAAVYEGGLAANDGTDPTPSLSVLAVDGDKVTHEEIFLNEGEGQPVRFSDRVPGPKDTAKAAAATAAAVGQAFATGDDSTLQTLVAPDVQFRDTALPRGGRGRDAMLAWWSNVPTVTLTNKAPIAGRGWAVVRWTIRQVFPTGVELALPGATVMEVRNGQVVRMTLYYNSSVMRLQS